MRLSGFRRLFLSGRGLAGLAVLGAMAFYFAYHSQAGLMMRLDSSSQSMYCGAAEELSKMGPDASFALPRLEAMLADKGCFEFGEDKLPDYVQAVGGIDPFIRSMKDRRYHSNPKAAWWLRYHCHQYPQRAHDLVPVFIDGLHSPDPLVRHACAGGLGKLGHAASDATPQLESALEDSDPDVRTAAAESLAGVHSLDGLKIVLVHPDPKIRRIAIMSLGGMSAQEIQGARDGYNELINDPEVSEVGRKKLQSLYPPPGNIAPLGFGKDALPYLISALDDPDPDNATAAADRLANFRRLALPALEPLENSALHAASAQTRSTALHALRNIGPEGMPAISQALRDPDTMVRDYAIRLLASYGAPGVPSLVAFIKQDWNSSSKTALAALESLHRDALPALPELRHWALHAPDADGRRAAIGALCLVGPEAFPAVEEATHDQDPAVSMAAQFALKGMGMRYGARNVIRTTVCDLVQRRQQYAGKFVRFLGKRIRPASGVLVNDPSGKCGPILVELPTDPDVQPRTYLTVVQDADLKKFLEPNYVLMPNGEMHKNGPMKATLQGRFDVAPPGKEFGHGHLYDLRLVLQQVSHVSLQPERLSPGR